MKELYIGRGYNAMLNMSNFKHNLRRKRKEYDLTMEQMSELLDLSYGFYGLLERGERFTNVNRIIKICKVFDITMDELFLPVDVKDEDFKQQPNRSLLNMVISYMDDELVEVLYKISWILIKSDRYKNRQNDFLFHFKGGIGDENKGT